jgi:uridylate kinase
MLLTLLNGQATAAEIAGLARGTAQCKIPQLAKALEGHRMTHHVRFLVRIACVTFGSGNPYFRTALVQCAWAATRKHDSVFRERFQKLAPRRG